MNFLFDNPLANMPGQWFLFLYAIAIIGSATAYYLLKQSLDWTAKMPLPLIPSDPDPYEIAYLRGGENEFARAVIFSLVKKGFLEIVNDKNTSYISLVRIQPNWTTLSQMERSVLGWFQETREVKHVFEPYGFVEILKPYSGAFEQKLQSGYLIMPSDVAMKTRLCGLLIGGIVLLLGAYKLIAAILHGRYNIIFLIILSAIAFFVFAAIAKTSRLSSLGKQYLARLQNAFERLKTQVQQNGVPQGIPESAMASVDPFLLTVGLFGAGALSGTMYNEYEKAFHRSSAAGGSGCGSSCGSSSCSSGGGDGGGSCGGGCGGCGGGD